MRFYTQLIGATIISSAVLLSACGTIPQHNGLTAARYALQPDNGKAGSAQATELHTAIYSSPLAAVLAATETYNPLSIAQDREFIGVILRQNGVYRYTVGQGKSGEDTVTVRLAKPKSAEIVAFWHTHGAAGPGRKYFSAVDTALVKSWNKPFYMADYSGALRVFNPGDSTISAIQAGRLNLGRQAGYAKGDYVLAQDGRRVRVATSLLARRQE